jgi:elongation factor 1-alpha
MTGYTPFIECHTARVACRFDTLVSRINLRNAGVEEVHPKCLRSYQAGVVELIPTRPLCVEVFSKCNALGRFQVVDDGKVVAVGIISAVWH